jgi:hypothetical protein
VYRFAGPGRLNALRLDPSEEANALIKSVIVRSNDRSVPVTGAQLGDWPRNDAEIQFEAGEQVTPITTRQRAAFVMGTVNIDVTQPTSPLLRNFRLEAGTLLWSCCLAGVVFLLLSARVGRLAPAACIAAIAITGVWIAYALAPWLLTWPAAIPDVDQTIGRESFFGASKAIETRATNWAVA